MTIQNEQLTVASIYDALVILNNTCILNSLSSIYVSASDPNLYFEAWCFTLESEYLIGGGSEIKSDANVNEEETGTHFC